MDQSQGWHWPRLRQVAEAPWGWSGQGRWCHCGGLSSQRTGGHYKLWSRKGDVEEDLQESQPVSAKEALGTT